MDPTENLQEQIETETTPEAYSLVWNSSDGKSSIEMGDFPSREDAEAAIPDARDRLLSECRNETERESILAGSWEILAVEPEIENAWIEVGSYRLACFAVTSTDPKWLGQDVAEAYPILGWLDDGYVVVQATVAQLEADDNVERYYAVEECAASDIGARKCEGAHETNYVRCV